MVELPSDEIMRQLSRMAIEQVTASIASQAREFANTLPLGISGRQALFSFADSIDATNSKVFPKGGDA